MMRPLLTMFAAVGILVTAAAGSSFAADSAAVPLVEPYLTGGGLAKGDAALAARIKAAPNDQQARFGLGVLQFVRAVEHLGQSLYNYGLQDSGASFGIPFLRLPVAANPKPAKITYQLSRQVLQDLLDDLAKAEATLVDVKGDVKLPLHFALIRLDLDGDGQAAQGEALWSFYARLNSQAGAPPPGDDFVIGFDTADVYWLRGYCHLLSALCEVALAHDGQKLFDHTAQLFFMNPETPYGFLGRGRQEFTDRILDFIALIHLTNLPVVEPKRMTSALDHLEQVIALSRQNWQAILAETDDDHEWIPNPKQKGVVPGVQNTLEMTGGWQEFLGEAERILAGKKLLPFWRGDAKRGINLRRVFTEPRTLDLVLWIQGTAALPYLEAGEISTPEVWRRFDRLFRGEFVGFALWFN